MTAEQFLQTLQSAGVSASSLREQTKAEIAWTALVRGRYGRQVRVSEQRIDDMLNRIKSSLDKPQYHLAEIFLFAPDQGSRANAQTRAETLIRQINQGAEFQAVAQQFSAAPSASAGGDLGWLSEGDMRPEIQAAIAAAAAPPLMLPPIESEGGVYIVALLGKREPSAPDAASMNLQQVVARGDGAAEKIAQVKAKATTCGQIADAVKGVDGVTATPMNGVDIGQVQPLYRTALQAAADRPVDRRARSARRRQDDVLRVRAHLGRPVHPLARRNPGAAVQPGTRHVRGALPARPQARGFDRPAIVRWPGATFRLLSPWATRRASARRSPGAPTRPSARGRARSM